MLVITRRDGERFVLDGRIVIQIVTTRIGRVQLGISAPADVDIQREELLSSRLLAEAVAASQEGRK